MSAQSAQESRRWLWWYGCHRCSWSGTLIGNWTTSDAFVDRRILSHLSESPDCARVNGAGFLYLGFRALPVLQPPGEELEPMLEVLATRVVHDRHGETRGEATLRACSFRSAVFVDVTDHSVPGELWELRVAVNGKGQGIILVGDPPALGRAEQRYVARENAHAHEN